MSPARQRRPLTAAEEPFLIVRSQAADLSGGFVIETHEHPWHQLLWACSGAMTVTGGRASWMVPPGKSVFLPAGIPHSIHMWGKVGFRSLYFPASLNATALEGSECRVLSVTPLLRELILRIIEVGALDGRISAHRNLSSVLLEEMALAPVTPVSLPLPEDPRARKVAGHILSCPSSGDSIDALARRYGASRRTLERLFRRQTGLSFGMWRQKARLLDSIRLLAEGKSVTEAAFDSGYAGVSAFVAAFKRTFGYTPGRL